jgi:hypothetical protein
MRALDARIHLFRRPDAVAAPRRVDPPIKPADDEGGEP